MIADNTRHLGGISSCCRANQINEAAACLRDNPLGQVGELQTVDEFRERVVRHHFVLRINQSGSDCKVVNEFLAVRILGCVRLRMPLNPVDGKVTMLNDLDTAKVS